MLVMPIYGQITESQIRRVSESFACRCFSKPGVVSTMTGCQCRFFARRESNRILKCHRLVLSIYDEYLGSPRFGDCCVAKAAASRLHPRGPNWISSARYLALRSGVICTICAENSTLNCLYSILFSAEWQKIFAIDNSIFV